jgi:hypothetical protein
MLVHVELIWSVCPTHELRPKWFIPSSSSTEKTGPPHMNTTALNGSGSVGLSVW